MTALRSALLARQHSLVAATCAGLAAANVARPSAALLAAGALGAFGAALASARRQLVWIAVALALGGWWWGGLRLEALDRSALLPLADRIAPTVAVVTGPPRRGAFSLRMPARVHRFGDLALDEPVLLVLPLGRSPPQGAILDLVARVQLPRGDEGGFDEAVWLRRHGVHVVLRAPRWRMIGRRGGVYGAADRLRSYLARSLAPGLRGERRAVVAGVVLGDDSGLSPELRDRFRASGLYHLLAVSGSNVILVAGGVLLVGWLLGVPRWLGEVGALAAIGAYVLAVGAQPSVVRAGIAGALASLAWLASRQRDRWYFLLLGALALLAWNPYVLLDAGFQLSFAAVASIFLLVRPIERRLEGYPVPRSAASVAAVSVACGIATAPILWVQFHAVPVLTVPANALAVPAAGPLLALGLGAAVVGPLSPSAAAALGWLNGWCAAYLAACARIVGGLPFAQVRSTGGALALLGIAISAAAATRLPRHRRQPLFALAALAVALTVVWHLRPVAEAPAPHGLRITFLDVGQGDSILLQAPSGSVLVDEGPPEAQVARQLRQLGVRRLSALVLTHPQRDHVGGAADVLRTLRVALVLDPRIPSDSSDERAALGVAATNRVPVVEARAGRSLRLGRLRLRIVWPDGPGPPGEDPNQHATVVLASYGDVDVLLTADAESDVTLPLHLPPVEILKVAHHGSADTGLPELLERLRPRVAVISVGERNDYGHPTASTLAALRGAPGLALYRTDRDGRVVVESDGERIQVRSER